MPTKCGEFFVISLIQNDISINVFYFSNELFRPPQHALVDKKQDTKKTQRTTLYQKNEETYIFLVFIINLILLKYFEVGCRHDYGL